MQSYSAPQPQSSHSFASVGGNPSQAYLQATVSSASPARLRLMLIERAQQVAAELSNVWQSGTDDGPNGHSLKLFDILSELLSGVTGGSTTAETETCRQVADLYVFLIQHLIQAESVSDSTAATEIATVLAVEAETWRIACASANEDSNGPASGGAGLNFTA